MSLRALLDGIPDDDREWLPRHRSDAVGPRLRAAFEHLIDPAPGDLDEVSHD